VARGVLTEPSAHFQAVAVPVHADGRVVGVLLLGAEIGQTLALDLRQQMRCEVTFLSQGAVTGTTLRTHAERTALMQMLKRARLGPDDHWRRLGMLRMKVGSEGEFLTLVRQIPGSDPEAGQYYVMQRSFDPELLFQRTVRNDLLAVAAVALILAIATSFVFSEQILRPVQKLVHGAREMEAGNYEHPIEVVRDDELGYLADQFTRMRSREQAYVSSLERATRLKSEFISIASHELRTPISVLSGYRDLLAEGSLGELEPKQAKVVEAMREYLDRLRRVAEDASMIAEMRNERMTLDRRPSPLPGVVRLAVDSALASAGGRNVRVETEVETPHAIVEVDSQALAQALTHLVTNGIRFTPDGGRVRVTASARDGLLSIAVADTGVGMNEAVVASLHAHGAAERDAAHHRSAVGLEFNSGGLGLGYTLARGIVAAHGGQIEIASRQGEGSTFTVRIPVESTELRIVA
jgi:signal transduction histidine kinase